MNKLLKRGICYKQPVVRTWGIWATMALQGMGALTAAQEAPSGSGSAPQCILIQNSGTSSSWEAKGLSWNQTFYFSNSTQSISETYPAGSQLGLSRYSMFAGTAVPTGTTYHTYHGEARVLTGDLSGLPKYSMVVAESPTGELSIIYTARRGEANEMYQKNDGSQYQAFDAQCIFGGAGYEGARQEGNSPALSQAVSFLWEGGGFGPGYSPNMALPIGYFERIKKCHDQAISLAKGLKFEQGQWSPSN